MTDADPMSDLLADLQRSVNIARARNGRSDADPAMCQSRGPRIGTDGTPRCVLDDGHPQPHVPDTSWHRHIDHWYDLHDPAQPPPPAPDPAEPMTLVTARHVLSIVDEPGAVLPARPVLARAVRVVLTELARTRAPRPAGETE